MDAADNCHGCSSSQRTAGWRPGELVGDPSLRVGVSEDADGLTTFVACDTDLLRHLAVRPDLWGAGLAKVSMDWALDRGPTQRLWCLETNSRTLGVFERHGWRSGPQEWCSTVIRRGGAQALMAPVGVSFFGSVLLPGSKARMSRPR